METQIVYTTEPGKSPIGGGENKQRGIGVYNYSQLQAITGRDHEGRLLTWGAEQPYFYLTVPQRTEIVKLCAPVHAIVSSRMQRISSMDFSIVPAKDREEELADRLKDYYAIYRERVGSGDMTDRVTMASAVQKIKEVLPDVLPDLRNFSSALVRWTKRIRTAQKNKCEEIRHWLAEPNNGVTWEAYVKKFIFSLMVHGAVATYKQTMNGKIENFDVLPGGTVYRLKSQYFDGVNGFVQVIPSFEPQIYFADEISYAEYLPTSDNSHSMIPLEALINKIVESMFFDNLMATQADGTKPPEKVVIVTNPTNPFANFDKPEMTEVPLDTNEQQRIEQKMNTPKKGAIITFSGNDAKVIDLSRENTMGIQNERQKDIRSEVGLVFNASDIEMNLGGGDNTSGRATAETQYEIDLGRGVFPLVKLLESKINRDILPFRYGSGYLFEFKKMKDEKEEREVDSLRLNNGEITINELREEKGYTPFDGKQFDIPRGATLDMPEQGETPQNPIFTKSVK